VQLPTLIGCKIYGFQPKLRETMLPSDYLTLPPRAAAQQHLHEWNACGDARLEGVRSNERVLMSAMVAARAAEM